MKPEIIRQYIEQQTCWICGKGGWKALSHHISKKHDITAFEVRNMAGLLKRDKLVSPEMTEYYRKFFTPSLEGHVKLNPAKSAKRIWSDKGRKLAQAKAKAIQPLIKKHGSDKKPHLCICGQLIETSAPRCCSPQCVRTAIINANKRRGKHYAN